MIRSEVMLDRLTIEEFLSYLLDELKKYYLSPFARDIRVKEIEIELKKKSKQISAQMLEELEEELEALQRKYDELQELEFEELRDLEKEPVPGSSWETGWHVLVQFIIRKGGEYNNLLQDILDCKNLHWGHRDTFLNKALSEAAWWKNMEAFMLLFADNRVDPSFDHNRAIRYASEKGCTEMVYVLLEDERVDPSDGGPPGKEYPVYKSGVCALRVDVPRPPNLVLAHAAQRGDAELVERLLADSRVSGKSVDSALSKVQDEEIKEMLLAVRTNSGPVETHYEMYKRSKKEAYLDAKRTSRENMRHICENPGLFTRGDVNFYSEINKGFLELDI